MRTFKFYLSILFLIICSDLFPQSYLSLEPGNKWFFKNGTCSGSPVFSEGCSYSNTVSSIISDSLLSNGYKYYKVNGIYIGLFEWFRSDTNWIYVYDSQDGLDLPVFNLHSEVGEIYNYGKESYQITFLRTRDTINIFDEKIEVLEFVLETGLDVTNEFILSKKFGFIKIVNIGFGGWGYSNLIGCVLNGISYGEVTSIEQNSNVIPSRIELYQNYPNPFNPSTKIKIDIKETGLVLLKVYDVLGSEVRTLLNEEKSPGIYTITFDAKGLPSGVYFYRIAIHSDRMTAGNFVQTKKLLLMK